MPNLSDTEKAKIILLYHLTPLASENSLVPTGPPLRIIIIRHGEKPDEGDNLSCAGLNRALALPTVLKQLMPLPPDFTYVPVIGIGGPNTTRLRMLQTVMPYAVQHNLCINTNFEVESTREFARQLRHHRGTVLVVWEHNNIVEIAKDLGLEDAQDWPHDDYDSIWTITFSEGGPKGKAKKPKLTKSRQHIYPTGVCPGQ